MYIDARGVCIKGGGFTELIDGRPVRPNLDIVRKQYPGATLPRKQSVSADELRQIKRDLEWDQVRDEGRRLREKVEDEEYAIILGVLHVPHYKQGEAWAAQVADDLGVKCPDIDWFLPAAAISPGGARAIGTFKGVRGLRGRYDCDRPSRILVTATGSLRQSIRTIAHEVRHKWQVTRYGPPADAEDLGRREADADAYADSALAWWAENADERN